MREPWPRTMYSGSQPTLRKARTGEFTPPGINCSARFCSLRDSSVLRVIGSSFLLFLYLIEFIGVSRNCNTGAISVGYLGNSCPSNREGLWGRPWGAPGCPFYFDWESLRWNPGSQFSVLSSRFSVPSGIAVSLNSRFLLLRGAQRPCHARGVVGDSEAALGIEQNDSTVAVEALLQIVHRFLRDPLRQAAGLHAIGRPLRQHQFHDGFAPSGGGSGGAEIIGITAAADQRRVAEAAGIFIERAAG